MTELQFPLDDKPDFDDFWSDWPNKVAKKDARNAWNKAIAGGADPAAIIEGRDNYKRCKPDWKAWMHPATFINGERWEDEYEEPPKILSRDEQEAMLKEIQERVKLKAVNNG